MSRKKGLSAEEKRVRLKELFVETKNVFLLKELEKIAPKEKGIVSMSVEDVLKSLLDDNIVSSDKIGTSNYFWLFPSQELVMKTNRIEDLEKQLTALKRKREIEDKRTSEILKGREETDERAAKISKLKELLEVNGNYHKSLEKYAENDPELIDAMKQDIKDFVAYANRWTDNIFTLRSYVENKYNLPGTEFDQKFQIPEDFDYVEN